MKAFGRATRATRGAATALIAGSLDYGNGSLGVWAWPGNNLGATSRTIYAPAWCRSPTRGSRGRRPQRWVDRHLDVHGYV
jgi:hypothetical protein